MADHYGTLAAALAYHETRGNQVWTAAGMDDEKRLAALVRASQALDALYGPRYPGTIAAADQDLLWPRLGVTWRGQNLASDVVPAPITKAAYELAVRELEKPGSIVPDLPAGPQKVLTGVKGITWQVVNDGSNRRAPLIPAVDGLLYGLVTPSTNNTAVTSLVRY